MLFFTISLPSVASPFNFLAMINGCGRGVGVQIPSHGVVAVLVGRGIRRIRARTSCKPSHTIEWCSSTNKMGRMAHTVLGSMENGRSQNLSPD
jgi:hypothetical protein